MSSDINEVFSQKSFVLTFINLHHVSIFQLLKADLTDLTNLNKKYLSQKFEGSSSKRTNSAYRGSHHFPISSNFSSIQTKISVPSDLAYRGITVHLKYIRSNHPKVYKISTKKKVQNDKKADPYLERSAVAPFMAGIGGGCTGGVTLLLDDALLYPGLNTSCWSLPPTSVPTSVCVACDRYRQQNTRKRDATTRKNAVWPNSRSSVSVTFFIHGERHGDTVMVLVCVSEKQARVCRRVGCFRQRKIDRESVTRHTEDGMILTV